MSPSPQGPSPQNPSPQNQGLIDMVARRTSASRTIAAAPEAIFELLVNPANHSRFDGSDMVNNAAGNSNERLSLGSKFQMNMTFKFLPYRIGNTVVEFDENRLIAWQHFGKHRWRYVLEPIGEGTLVTETFDWSTALVPKAIEAVGYPKAHLGNIERTLERLAGLVEESA